jgi:hypothetical protein
VLREVIVEKTIVVLRRPSSRNKAPLPSLANALAAAAAQQSPKSDLSRPSSPLWTAVIRGEPTPRARMLDVVITDGTPRLVKSEPARVWQNRAMWQLINRRPARPLAVELVLDCRFWSSVTRPAIDEALVVDVLERAAIIAHAGQIREKHVFAEVDRADPRVAVTLAPLASQS